MPRIGAKPLMVAGALLAATAMGLLTQVGLSTSFTTLALPAQVILGLGLGFIFVPLSSLALVGVPEHDAGAASATLNATQQVGGSLGAALLNTFFVTAATNYFTEHASPTVDRKVLLGQSEVHGYTVAFMWGGILLTVSALVIIFLIKVRKQDLPTEGVVHAG